VALGVAGGARGGREGVVRGALARRVMTIVPGAHGASGTSSYKSIQRRKGEGCGGEGRVLGDKHESDH